FLRLLSLQGLCPFLNCRVARKPQNPSEDCGTTLLVLRSPASRRCARQSVRFSQAQPARTDCLRYASSAPSLFRQLVSTPSISSPRSTPLPPLVHRRSGTSPIRSSCSCSVFSDRRCAFCRCENLGSGA